MNYEATSILRECIEEAGALKEVGDSLTKRCYEMLTRIEEIASTQGRGAVFGKANVDYAEFFMTIAPFLSEEQAASLKQRYGEIKNGFKELKHDGRVRVRS